ncbi:ABC transporter ATP-binding protein [Endozoicomonas arenosclerae]|uniref:ABC transporter ATP-binding protein n=1 Tax=Endozoicomonas arenosclerae TaxID=1633495 RepID=UPI000784D1E2|nr:ATP-binding cassette domain-containing protein [Endozoicomonas arenosclerae]
MTSSSDAILTIKGLNMQFGGIKALENIDFQVPRGSITALIGPNGAGKTTVFNCLTGFYRATSGKIELNAHKTKTSVTSVLGESFKASDLWQPVRFGRRLYYKLFGGSHQVNRAGLARTFQNIRLFKEMTALENLLVAQHMQLNRSFLAGIINTRSFQKSEENALNKAWYWLEQLDLINEGNQLAGQLPYGKQRRLEIARALCTNPELLCLDEPAAGLNPQETAELAKTLNTLRSEHKLTILLIEHDMGMVMKISSQIVVLDHGLVIARGSPDQIKNDPAVISAYLGTEEETGVPEHEPALA